MSEIIVTSKVSVPVVGLGTYLLTGSSGTISIANAIECGYRHIDTAQYYKNESEVGKAIRKSGIAREELFITTKVWPSDFMNLVISVEDSLRKLQTSYVDLLLLHWPADDFTNNIGIDQLNRAQYLGYAKYIGVSNFNIEQLKIAVANAPVVCNQVGLNPYISQEPMLKYLKENDMFLTAYTPLAHGKIFKNPLIKKLALKYKKTPAQLTLHYLIKQGNVSVIPKSSAKERLIENLKIFDFQISNDDMLALSGIAVKY